MNFIWLITKDNHDIMSLYLTVFFFQKKKYQQHMELMNKMEKDSTESIEKSCLKPKNRKIFIKTIFLVILWAVYVSIKPSKRPLNLL